jgi:hypothetical protein
MSETTLESSAEQTHLIATVTLASPQSRGSKGSDGIRKLWLGQELLWLLFMGLNSCKLCCDTIERPGSASLCSLSQQLFIDFLCARSWAGSKADRPDSFRHGPMLQQGDLKASQRA